MQLPTSATLFTHEIRTKNPFFHQYVIRESKKHIEPVAAKYDRFLASNAVSAKRIRRLARTLHYALVHANLRDYWSFDGRLPSQSLIVRSHSNMATEKERNAIVAKAFADFDKKRVPYHANDCFIDYLDAIVYRVYRLSEQLGYRTA